MLTPTQLAKLDAVATQIEDTQQQLQAQLTQRAPEPQSGDVYVFKYTPELQWVILKQRSSQRFLAVLADTCPLVGSTDVKLPETVLGSPLTLRCAQTMTFQQADLDQGLRVGMLAGWHLQRVLSKYEQIVQKRVISTVAQQQIDADLDYMEWLEKLVTAKQQLHSHLQKQPVKKNWQAGLQGLFMLSKQWQLATALGVLLVTAVGLNYFHMASNSSPLEQSIQTVATLEPDTLKLLLQDKYELPKPKQHFGFVSKNASPTVLVEIRNGLEDAQNQLFGRPTLHKQTAFYDLGRWIFNVWIATDEEFNQALTPEFWQTQHSVLNDLVTQVKAIELDKYEQEKSVVILKMLEKISANLKNAQDNQSSDGFYVLAGQLDGLIDILNF